MKSFFRFTGIADGKAVCLLEAVNSSVCLPQRKDSNMDKGKKNGSFRDRIRRTWISLPLRKKAGTITVLAAFAVSCSILMNLVTAGFGMNGSGRFWRTTPEALPFMRRWKQRAGPLRR